MLASNCQLKVYEDNEATIKMIKSGKFSAMRHVGRTHRVDLAWLHEVVEGKEVSMSYIETDKQAADIFTKPFTDSQKWGNACRLINHVVIGAGGGTRAAAATPKEKGLTSLGINKVVGFCCSETSLLGSQAQKSGIPTVRLTEADGVTTPGGLGKAISACKDRNVLLWASMPCTGGSP